MQEEPGDQVKADTQDEMIRRIQNVDVPEVAKAQHIFRQLLIKHGLLNKVVFSTIRQTPRDKKQIEHLRSLAFRLARGDRAEVQDVATDD